MMIFPDWKIYSVRFTFRPLKPRVKLILQWTGCLLYKLRRIMKTIQLYAFDFLLEWFAFFLKFWIAFFDSFEFSLDLIQLRIFLLFALNFNQSKVFNSRKLIIHYYGVRDIAYNIWILRKSCIIYYKFNL